MHESAIAQQLIAAAQEALGRSAPLGKATLLRINVGRLAGVHCESLRFAFEVLASETPLRGAALDIRETKAVAVCADCGARTEIDDPFAVCPACGSAEVRLEGGGELVLESIEVEEPDA